MENISNRIEQIAKNEGITITSMEKQIGASKGVLSRAINNNTDIQSKWIQILVENYPRYNPGWLITGKGNMIKSKEKQPGHIQHKGIPLISVEAMAGYANGDTQVMEYELDNFYNIPDFENKGVKFLIRASGSSMYPKYSNGDILACRPVTDLSFFQWGKVYVLDTDQGPLVKRLFACPDDDDYLECRSENKENYPPFRIKKSSIRKVSIVVGVVRME